MVHSVMCQAIMFSISVLNIFLGLLYFQLNVILFINNYKIPNISTKFQTTAFALRVIL